MIHSLATVGFPPHEQHVLGVFFKMAARREHTYQVIADTTQADALLINADSDTGMKWLTEASTSQQKILLVGKTGSTLNLPTVQRPYALLTVVEQLDLLFYGVTVASPSAPAAASAVAPATARATALAPALRATLNPFPVQPQPIAKTWFASTQIEQRPTLPPATITTRHSGSVRQGTGVAPVAARTASSSTASAFLGLSEELSSVQKEAAFDDILVVDDSDIALKFMQKLLTRFGFRAELARSGEEALARTSKKSYRFVFIDVMMDGMDGYQTCRAIKQRRYTDGKAPVVVMLTSRGASLDKMRGSLAGCDAYLTKPLEENALLQTLSKFDEQVQRGFQETNVGSSEVNQFQPLK